MRKSQFIFAICIDERIDGGFAVCVRAGDDGIDFEAEKVEGVIVPRAQTGLGELPEALDEVEV